MSDSPSSPDGAAAGYADRYERMLNVGVGPLLTRSLLVGVVSLVALLAVMALLRG